MFILRIHFIYTHVLVVPTAAAVARVLRCTAAVLSSSLSACFVGGQGPKTSVIRTICSPQHKHTLVTHTLKLRTPVYTAAAVSNANRRQKVFIHTARYPRVTYLSLEPGERQRVHVELFFPAGRAAAAAAGLHLPGTRRAVPLADGHQPLLPRLPPAPISCRRHAAPPSLLRLSLRAACYHPVYLLLLLLRARELHSVLDSYRPSIDQKTRRLFVCLMKQASSINLLAGAPGASFPHSRHAFG